MKASIIREYGSYDVIRYEDIPRPIIKSNQILVKVHSASVNPVDWKVRNGKFKIVMGNKFPKILGFECSGEIIEVGANITKFKIGDRVIGASFSGTYAEFVAIDEKKAIKLPDYLTYDEASTIPIACMTAYFSLYKLGNLKKGEKVLINGASGGVGLYAIQFAHIIGADVTAICSQKNFELVSSFGKARMIDYHFTDFTMEKEKYNVIFDVVNSLDFVKCRDNLTEYGTFIGTDISKKLLKNIIFSFLSKQKAKMINNNPKSKDVEEILPYFKQGKLKAVIDKTFSLSDVKEAHKYSESGRARGKIIIKVIEKGF